MCRAAILPCPPVTDYWINDSSGDPLLVMTWEVEAALTRASPGVLRQVREVVGERLVTIVFDRGGWSPKLFATMINDGFDVLTYRKGECRRVNEAVRSASRRVRRASGRHLLDDQPVRFLEGKLSLRQVTRLCDDGHQTQERSPTACSSAGDRRTSSNTCARSFYSMRWSITASSRKTRPEQSRAPRFGSGDP